MIIHSDYFHFEDSGNVNISEGRRSFGVSFPTLPNWCIEAEAKR